MVDQKVYIPVLLKPQKIYAENGEIQECTGTDKVGPILLNFHKQYNMYSIVHSVEDSAGNLRESGGEPCIIHHLYES